MEFQPTLPVRGATNIADPLSISVYISTHAPRAGSDSRMHTFLRPLLYFNPRSPCGERRETCGRIMASHGFQPTLPVRGATIAHSINALIIRISTHAPRAGSDTGFCAIIPYMALFQPTLPVRGATDGLY